MKKDHTFSFLAHEAQDLPGQWVAHCLDFDLVIQGDSFTDALDYLCDAVRDALADGAPHGFKRAPEEFWNWHVSVLEEGERAELTELRSKPDRLAGKVIAGYLSVVREEKVQKPTRKAWAMPAQQAAQAG